MNINFADYFYYDETSPSCLRWKVARYAGKNHHILKASAGGVAGFKNKKGYWRVKLNSKPYFCHRIILVLHGIDPVVADHILGLDAGNCIDNLRSVDTKTNCRNRDMKANNTSGHSGVKWETKRPRGDTPIHYAVAFWSKLDGKQSCKCFRVDRMGLLPAFKAACDYRNKMIDELNEQGAGYTKRHGT